MYDKHLLKIYRENFTMFDSKSKFHKPFFHYGTYCETEYQTRSCAIGTLILSHIRKIELRARNYPSSTQKHFVRYLAEY